MKLLQTIAVLAIFGGLIMLTIQSTNAIKESNKYQLSAPVDEQIVPTQGMFKTFLPVVSLTKPNPKKGLGVAASPVCGDMGVLATSWYFNWKAYPDDCLNPDPRFVPRIYNAGSMAEPELSNAIKNAQISGWLMGFNEPNLFWQGGVSPEDGAKYWKQIEDRTKDLNIKLVSPAPNQWEPNHDPTRPEPYGNQWTWAMVDAYKAQNNGNKPRFDALAWNIYKTNHEDIVTFLRARRSEARNQYGYDLPFWIVEYGGECPSKGYTGNEVIMQQTTKWFNETDWIGRYAWYANRLEGPGDDPDAQDYSSCSLIDPATGSPTELGKMYQGF
jgi:hypothetical protein